MAAAYMILGVVVGLVAAFVHMSMGGGVVSALFHYAMVGTLSVLSIAAWRWRAAAAST